MQLFFAHEHFHSTAGELP